MEWHYSEQRGQHLEWRRQKKHNDQDDAWRQPDNATKTVQNPNVSSNIPFMNHWFQNFPFLEGDNPPPPGYLGPSNGAISLRTTEPPKTPPSFTTASFRRRCMGSQPISPPNTLRLASTNASRHLPRPNASPRFLRSTIPPLDCECVGDPRFSVYRVRLPEYLIYGPLDALITASELYANRLPKGWETNLFSLTKCDIACQDIPGISSYLDPIVTYISLTMKFLYGCSKITMSYNQPHIVKYAAEIDHAGGKTTTFAIYVYSFFNTKCNMWFG